MTEIGSHAGKDPWPSLDWASWIFDRASWVLVVSLAIGLGATVAIVWMGIVKEHHWDLAREHAAREIEGTKLEIAKANKETAIARLDAERIRQRLVWRMIDPEPQKRIADSLRRFAPQMFSVVLYRNNDPEALNLRASLKEALEAAGWQSVEVPSRPLLSTEGIWLEWANSSGGRISAAKDALSLTLRDNVGAAPTLFSSSDKYEGLGPIIVIGIGKKPPSPLELPPLGELAK